jgi:hypothetical protein
MAFEQKILHLPGTRLSPEVVLHRTLTKLDHIRSIAIVVQWEDESFDCDWSQMRLSDLCMAEKIFSMTVTEAINTSNDN